MTVLDVALTLWLEERAEALDADDELAGELVPRFALANLFETGVPASEPPGLSWRPVYVSQAGIA